MNRSRLMLIGVLALVLGGFASLLAYRTLQKHSGASQGDMQDAVVATADLAVGARVQDSDVRIVRFPGDAVPQGIFHRTKSVVGRGVVQSIAQGEFILPTKLAGENSGSGLASTIPAGMRAVSVRVSDISSVGGFVQPGTRVDVLMTGNPGGSAEPQAITVLKNVAVLANGMNMDRGVRGETQNAPIITLAVSPDDAQKLALATAQGRIELALRNPMDTSQNDVAAIGMHSLYQNTGLPVPAPVHTRVKPVTIIKPPPAPTVEVIKGDKREEVKVDDQGKDDPK
jgi:pilus assembly protein CpaB